MYVLTWANAVYPGGLAALKKIVAGAYTQIGIAKYEWQSLLGTQNQFFVESLTKRIEAVSRKEEEQK